MTYVIEDIFNWLINDCNNVIKEDDFEVEDYETTKYWNYDKSKILGHTRKYGIGGGTTYRISDDLLIDGSYINTLIYRIIDQILKSNNIDNLLNEFKRLLKEYKCMDKPIVLINNVTNDDLGSLNHTKLYC